MAKIIAFKITLDGQERIIATSKQLKEAMQEVRKAFENTEFGTPRYKELERVQASLTNTSQALSRQSRETAKDLISSGKNAQVAEGSYEQLAATLSILTARYKALSAAERSSDIGKNLAGEVNRANSELKKIDAALGNYQRNVGNYSSAFGQLSLRMTDFLKGGFIVAGVERLVQGIEQLARRAVEINIKVSDLLGDIQRIGQFTAAQTQEIFRGVEALDTRTGIDTLLELTAVGARLGVPRQELVGFTKALDQLKVALGSELGDNAEEVSTKLGKLQNIFEVGGGDTGERFLRIGNAIVDLANRGVATGEFLSDFGQRLGGIAEIADLSLGAVLGLGAGFEELGQTAEVSSTAINSTVLLIGKDIDRVAKLTGIAAKDLRQLFKDNPAEALIQVAQRLVNSASGIEEISQALGEFGVDGRRAVAVLGTLGANADFFREKIGFANEALENTGQIALATEIKQKTLAAQVERLGTVYDELAANPSIQNFFATVVGGAADAIVAIDNLISAYGGLDGAIAMLLGRITGNQLLSPFVVSLLGDAENQSGEELTAQFQSQSQAVDDLDAKANALIRTYIELKDVSKPTPAQARELKEAIKELAETFPSAAYGVGEYGEALFINTDIVNQQIDGQKKLADTIQQGAIKALRGEIAATEEVIAKGKERLEVLQARVVKGEQGEKLTAEIVKQNKEIQANVAQLTKSKAALDNVLAGGTSAFGATKDGAKDSKDAIDKLNKSLNLTEKAAKFEFAKGSIGALREELQKLEKELDNANTPEKFVQASEKIAEVTIRLNQTLRDFNNAALEAAGATIDLQPIGFTQVDPQAELQAVIDNSELKKQVEKDAFDEVQQYTQEAADKYRETWQEAEDERYNDRLERELDFVTEQAEIFSDSIASIGELAGEALAGQIDSAEEFFKEIVILFLEIFEQNVLLQNRATQLALAPRALAGDPTAIAGLTKAIVNEGLIRALFAVGKGVIRGFAEGGYTGNGQGAPDHTGYKPAGIVHEGEYVVPKRVIATQRGKELTQELEAMRKGYALRSSRGYFAGGGTVSALAQPSAAQGSIFIQNNLQLSKDDISAIAEAVRVGSTEGSRSGFVSGAKQVKNIEIASNRAGF